MRTLGLLALLGASSSVFAAEARLTTLANGLKVIETEKRDFHTGLLHKPKVLRGLGETHVKLAGCDELPDEFDLRDLEVVPNVKDQGQCGSCWAFSRTASLESAAAVATGKAINLSEQQLVSCDQSSYGCDGGFLDGFGYQIERGQTLESSFPYRAADVSCKSGLTAAAKGMSFVKVGESGNTPADNDVQCALYKSHTIPWITVSANANWSSMPSGSDAVYTSCGQGETNHAVGLVGWKKINGKVYFKVRNSWGSDWGSDAGRPGSEGGYAMMRLGCDNLGEEVAYIVAKETLACVPPLVKLPAEINAEAGDAVRLSVDPEKGVDYAWYQGKVQIAAGDSTSVTAGKDTVYTVVANNACGRSESSVRVKGSSN